MVGYIALGILLAYKHLYSRSLIVQNSINWIRRKKGVDQYTCIKECLLVTLGQCMLHSIGTHHIRGPVGVKEESYSCSGSL